METIKLQEIMESLHTDDVIDARIEDLELQDDQSDHSEHTEDQSEHSGDESD